MLRTHGPAMDLFKVSPSTNSLKNLEAKKCVAEHIHPESVSRSPILGKESPEHQIRAFDWDNSMPHRYIAAPDV